MTDEVLMKELVALRARVDAIEEARRRRWQLLRLALIVSCAVFASMGGVAWAANGECPNGLPFCFVANSPALASEVNQNFAQLKEWLETKVGSVGAANVVSSSVNVTGNATVNGQLAAGSANVTGGLSVAGVATVATLVANSSISTNGDVNAPSNSWGSKAKLGTTFAGDPCGQENGSECPPGQFVCGVYVTNTCNQEFFRSPFRIECCSL